ncbi:transcriptional regulator, TetR family [Arthrobacter sp. yr096]|uniref:SACE_7040 family transcriptional regulator n=1 Tax=Arthrobacter sp. yr096 TaxID=1761750 RepID=UPI0008D7E13F|nr:TetR/AcrR family transcriptional regulator [Arthrobacter sp. yr096]SEJ23867.1 transcriptional regulator, TetR family [Arthrobacter sp. yr096]
MNTREDNVAVGPEASADGDRAGTAHVGSDRAGTDHTGTGRVGTDRVGTDRVGTTQRSHAKELRRLALLTAAAGLFAENGFSRVSLEDLGAAAGVSGPAVYRHFPGKQAVLGELLLSVSRDLLEGGLRVVSESDDPQSALKGLIQFQVDFALSNPDVIRVQDRDFGSLSDADQAEVRSLQRSYVETWVDVLARIHHGADIPALRVRAHAAFGLINSTPHSVRHHGRKIAVKSARPILEQMAFTALTST